MKACHCRYEERLRHYPTGLTDFITLTVRNGMCHPGIYIYHYPGTGCLKFSGKDPVIAIVPQSLYRITYGKRTGVSILFPDDDLNISLCTQEHLLAHPRCRREYFLNASRATPAGRRAL